MTAWEPVRMLSLWTWQVRIDVAQDVAFHRGLNFDFAAGV